MNQSATLNLLAVVIIESISYSNLLAVVIIESINHSNSLAVVIIESISYSKLTCSSNYWKSSNNQLGRQYFHPINSGPQSRHSLYPSSHQDMCSDNYWIMDYRYCHVNMGCSGNDLFQSGMIIRANEVVNSQWAPTFDFQQIITIKTAWGKKFDLVIKYVKVNQGYHLNTLDTTHFPNDPKDLEWHCFLNNQAYQFNMDNVNLNESGYHTHIIREYVIWCCFQQIILHHSSYTMPGL